jgi:hypothetical protein
MLVFNIPHVFDSPELSIDYFICFLEKNDIVPLAHCGQQLILSKEDGIIFRLADLENRFINTYANQVIA